MLISHVFQTATRRHWSEQAPRSLCICKPATDRVGFKKSAERFVGGGGEEAEGAVGESLPPFFPHLKVKMRCVCFPLISCWERGAGCERPKGEGLKHPTSNPTLLNVPLPNPSPYSTSIKPNTAECPSPKSFTLWHPTSNPDPQQSPHAGLALGKHTKDVQSQISSVLHPK